MCPCRRVYVPETVGCRWLSVVTRRPAGRRRTEDCKKGHSQTIFGEEGINLIEHRVLAVGHLVTRACQPRATKSPSRSAAGVPQDRGSTGCHRRKLDVIDCAIALDDLPGANRFESGRVRAALLRAPHGRHARGHLRDARGPRRCARRAFVMRSRCIWSENHRGMSVALRQHHSDLGDRRRWQYRCWGMTGPFECGVGEVGRPVDARIENEADFGAQRVLLNPLANR